MRVNDGIKKQIRDLRKRGYSIPEISKECGISKSTALRYAKKVEILPRYRDRWLERFNAGKIVAQRRWNVALKEAKDLVGDINYKNWVLIATALYWAEGAKRDFSFSNTDPRMVKVFIYVLRNIFKIKNDDLKVSLRLYEDLDKNKCIRYWSKIIGINLSGNVSINTLKGYKMGKLQYGMCRIRVRRGGLLLKRFFAIIERIGDFAEPS